MVWMSIETAGGHMSQPIVNVDTSEDRPGRLEELKAAMNDLAQFVQANEPQLLAYNVYFSDDGTRMSVLHINPNSASLERHMKIAGPKFPPIGEFIRLLAIDVYGRPDDGLVEGPTAEGEDARQRDSARARLSRRICPAT